MSLLSNVKKGKIQLPPLVVIYGPDGVGKSSFAAGAPDPIFLGTEKGTANLNVARFPSPKNFKEALQAVDELTKEKHEFKTLALDSLDWLEPLVWEQVCFDHNIKNIEDMGYGKGYVYANKCWMDFMSRLTTLRETRGMGIIAIAHSTVKLVKDPQNQSEYDRYQLKLNDKAAALWREYVDSVLFANFEVITHTDKKGKTKAMGDGARYIYTERRPGFDAKNRLGLPFQLPLSYQDYSEAASQGQSESPDQIRKNIEELISQVGDPDLRQKVSLAVEQAGQDAGKLGVIQNRLRALTQAA